MKVDLGKDPLYDKKESPVKGIKQKQLERQRQMRIMRMNPVREKYEPPVDIIDPLPNQLKTYRADIEYKKTSEPSKASYNLKKYIIEQERNLKCLRLERLESEEKLNKGIKAEFKFDLSKSRSRVAENKSKEINIPCIEEMFKNQQKEYVLYESKAMKNKLSKAIQSIDNSLNDIKSFPLNSTMPILHHDQRKHSQRLPYLAHHANQNHSGLHQSHHQQHSHHGHQHSSSAHTTPVIPNEEDIEIDKIIEKKLKQSEKLREKLYREKKQIQNNQHRGDSAEGSNLNFFLTRTQKQKKKVLLKGVRSISFQDGDRSLKITPASTLLFELNRMMNGKDRKQDELSGLLKNSFQNREAILSEKSKFYEQETPFNDLTPSSQFRLRQLMDQKLLHRLELSKEQVNKFIDYLREIKEEYHVILNNTILEILKEVREILLSGKVMKSSDFSEIVKDKDHSELKGHPNELIVQTLFEMMI